MSLMFDCSYPIISSKTIKEYECSAFYRDAKEDIPPNMYESRGGKVSIYMFVYADLVGDKPYRRNQTGMLIFINKAPICCYSKSQATVEASSLVSEVCAMNAGVYIVEDLH